MDPLRISGSYSTVRQVVIGGALVYAGLFAYDAHAHLNDPNVPPCFAMKDDRVQPLDDVHGDNRVDFSPVDLAPINQTEFETGERLMIAFNVTGRLCSPFFVFLETETAKGASSSMIQQTSPSLVYQPGQFTHRIEHFVTFVPDPARVQPGATAELVKIRFKVAQYGSYKSLAQFELPIRAIWRTPLDVNIAGVPEYECADDMKLPPPAPKTTSRQCENSIPKPAGGVALDLDDDGICEWAVRDARCDKTNGNLCFRIVQEHRSSFRPILQFYNEFKLHAGATNHRGVSSVERGPLTNVTRFSEWQNGAYVQHMYVHDCSRVP